MIREIYKEVWKTLELLNIEDFQYDEHCKYSSPFKIFVDSIVLTAFLKFLLLSKHSV